MSIRVTIRHFTSYRFDRAVSLSPHVIRLRPAPHARTPVRGFALKVTPGKHFINWQQDPFGNWLARLVFPEKTHELTVDVEVIAELTVINPFDFFIEEYAQQFPFTYPDALAKELAPYRELAESGPRLRDWVGSVERTPRGTVDFLVALNQRLQRETQYTIRMEPGVQTCEDTLKLRRGSCRDSAWLLVQILRHLGLAARFVSGYLVQLRPDEKPLDGPAGAAEDFTDLHAWTEVYVPGAGWIGLDPTSGLFASEGHIPLAATPSPASAAPIDGYTDPCEVEFKFLNTVTRIAETPRVTLPYSDALWDAIQLLGRQVDEQLQANDVRLTMGGEPTFVSIDSIDAPEWNTDALGDHKRERAEVLWLRLRDRYAPNGLLHVGQGKWYPGEPLPRWALNLYWRADGQPLWSDARWLATPTKTLGHTVHDARAFAQALADALGVSRAHVRDAYEDGLYHLWQEARVAPNLDPASASLKDSRERRSLADKLSRGLDQPVGCALPIAWDWNDARFVSGPWNFRRERMYLLPGDSPLGLRLPLDALPWVDADEREPQLDVDPFAPRAPLPDFHGEVATRFASVHDFDAQQAEQRTPRAADDRRAVSVLHTALCIEARHGVLHVFFPPLTVLEHYLALLACVENVARRLNAPVVIEGYAPPRDPRLRHLAVTPDPGVIEVNIHPTASWDELVATTESLYAEARMSRLGAEKFMLDGRHTGTGGGNHVTLGGATAADSPFLRRPDLLQSFITYWQHHPALSYLFSGLFIGPTSQAPRVDEGRRDQIYELEIAFAQTPQGETPQPWLVDRLLRNLLVDLTGNTHRAEFCIDKLYSPEGAAGRQGIVEFRGFEMPPHARMSAVQMLLIRALVARFWNKPYRHALVDWGTELHDRFMLPHFLWFDLNEVLDDLARAGFAFERTWFEPFLDFRFPKYGATHVHGIDIELRAAIEPWYVLGEESSNRGTARFVDSSVERVQVQLRGVTDGRYLLTCNGRRVPLRPTGTQGEYVAGVRYRAWQPPSALHPTIGVHAPLTFDLYDTWNERSIGGCTYHVMHAGGRNYSTYPVNAFEAESRRIARYTEWGHTAPPMADYFTPRPSTLSSRFSARPPGVAHTPHDEAPARAFPYTLDLRRPAE
jgi:uncharacterized protein (DUF2126 family)